MKCYLTGITCIIFYIVIVINPTYSDLGDCGSLKFEQDTVMDCQSARLVYTPNNGRSRKWFKEGTGSPTTLYNSESPNNETKYIELKSGDSFILVISAVNLKDTGRYIVSCGGQSQSNRAYLNVAQRSTGQGCTGTCGKLSLTKNNIKEGGEVVFEFTVSPGRAVTWEKKDNSTFEQLVDQRYIKASNSNNRSHSLTILKSKYIDRGEYRVNCDANVSNSVYLNIVYSKPSVPAFSKAVSAEYCKPDGCILADLNKVVTVECFVTGGSKPIDLKILKNGKEITDAKQTQSEENKIIYHYVKYSFTPIEVDVKNGVIVTCTVKNPALTDVSSNSTMVYVKVDPEKIEVNPIELVEDTQGEVQCIETNVRPPLKAKLLINSNEEQSTSKKDEIMQSNLYTVTTSTTRKFTRSLNQVKVMCCSNVDNQVCGETKINVLFPPKNISVEELSKENRENGDTIVKLKYSVAESNPNSSVTLSGVKNVKRTLVDKKYEQKSGTHGWSISGIWIFNFTRENNNRAITFDVATDRFPDQTLQHVYKINITYFPIVTISGKETVYLGDYVILTCHVDSNPPSTISWNNQTDLIVETNRAEKLDLHLTNISIEHSQTYSCIAKNGIGGIKSRNITLTVKDPTERPVTEAVKPASESNIGSLVGTVIGCLILVIIIAIIAGLIIRKKRRNAPLERRNTPQIKIEERKPSSYPTGNEPLYNNMAASVKDEVDEQPEYACVIPKDKRGKANVNNEASKDAGKEHKEGGDNLVYADLDLAEYPDIAANRPLVTMHEQTEYVSIDFNKTGAAIIDNDGDKK